MRDLREQLREYGSFLDESASDTTGIQDHESLTDVVVRPRLVGREDRRATTMRVLGAAALVVLVAVSAAIVIRVSGNDDHRPVGSSSESRWRVAIALKDLPEGVSTRRIHGTPVFLVRRGDKVTTFLTNMHHIPGETVLFWCPAQKQFQSPTHGETFDRTGAVVGGPAFSGLDRLPTTVEGDVAHVDYGQVIADPRPRGTGVGDFSCDGGVRGGGRYRQPNGPVEQTLDVGIVAGTFDASSYTVDSGIVRIRVRSDESRGSVRIDDSRFAAVEFDTGAATSTATVALPPGAHTLAVSGLDVPGGEHTAKLIVTDPDVSPARTRHRSALALPERGTASSALLDDGTPAWVVRDDNGNVSVYDAASTHRPFGVGVLIGWCQQNQSFEDPMYGSQWDAQGRKRGGPAPTGLLQYPSTVTRDQVLVSGAPVAVTTPAPTIDQAPPGYIAPIGNPCWDPTEPDYNPGTSRRPNLGSARTISVRSLPARPSRTTPTTFLVKNARLVARLDRDPLLCHDNARATCVAVPIDGVTRRPQRGSDYWDQVALSGDLFITLGPNGPENAVFANGYTTD
jgi:Rieske Fe-S protein